MTVYHIGPNQQFTSIGAAPWRSLAPGDEVILYWREEPYRERLVIPCRGNMENRIRIRGELGPSGERPVIEATNATTNPQFAVGYQPLEHNALVMVWRLKGGTVIPGYFDIDNLEIRGATIDQLDKSFTGADGKTYEWDKFCAGLYLREFDSVRIVNCKLHGNAIGLFTGDADHCEDLLIEGNEIFGNGVIDSEFEHNSYVQCVRPIYRNNNYGRLRQGAYGGNLKDRSADVLIEDNRIEGGARMIDLSSWEGYSAVIRAAVPNAERVIIRKNTLVNREGDSITAIYSEGRESVDGKPITVQATNNTVIVERMTPLALFYTEYQDAAWCNAARNLFDVSPGCEFITIGGHGTLNLAENWLSPDAVLSERSWLPHTVNGMDTFARDGDGQEYGVDGVKFQGQLPLPPPPKPPEPPDPNVLDDDKAIYVGEWIDYPGEGFGGRLHYAAKGDGSATATWKVPHGHYEVAVTWTPNLNRATDAPFTVRDGERVLHTVKINQQPAPVGGWQVLGEFEGDLSVTLTNDADGYVIADAVRFRPVGVPPIPPADELLIFRVRTLPDSSKEVYAKLP